jgi:hypothetical protein
LAARKDLKNRVKPGGKTDVFSTPRLADGSAAERQMVSCFWSALSYVGGYPCGWRHHAKTSDAYTLELDFQVRVPQAAQTWEQLAAADSFISVFCQSTMKTYFKKQRHTGESS